VAKVSEDEVLLLWRALAAYRWPCIRLADLLSPELKRIGP
jgi:hypothetical protein